jgi:pimeloyl-ACP methyl ester carboxylesterase
VKFPVPWGHIAGREWGDPQGKHVLALHGWLDNANTFDKLIPRLSPALHVVSIDLPGHGQSSHRPRGTLYHVQDYIADVKYVIDALKWDKFSFLAHSMSTGVSSWFTAALPEMVESLVLIEGFGFVSAPLEDLPGRMGKALKGLGSLSNTVDTKVYSTWDELVDRMLEGHQVMDPSFTREAAATLSVRGSKKLSSGSYQFTRDLMLRAPSLLRIPGCVSSTFLSAVQCPVLLIVSENSLVTRVYIPLTPEMLPKQLKMVRVSGGHHVHLCQPEVLDRAVDTFLLRQTLHPDFTEISKL